MKELTPFQTWKANKGRLDLRQYTRSFQSRFKDKATNSTEICKIYTSVYKSGASVTDKYHITPLIMSFGKFRNYNDTVCVRGLNLFFLSKDEIIKLMETVYTFMQFEPEKRVPGMVKLHKQCVEKYPHAFKNFEEKRLLIANEVEMTEWGMIPLLHTHLFGIFNVTALKKDFEEEYSKPIIIKPRKVKKEIKKDEVESVSVEWTEGDTGIDFDDDI